MQHDNRGTKHISFRMPTTPGTLTHKMNTVEVGEISNPSNILDESSFDIRLH